jgi:hypothetical protein
MAEISGVDYKLDADTKTIGGKSDATINLESDTAELAPTQTTGTQFRRRLKGLNDWSVDYDALWIEDGAALSGFSPTVTVDPSNQALTLKQISEVTITLERDAYEAANSSHSQYLSREPGIVNATAELSVDVDPSTFYGSSEASRLLLDAWESVSGEVDVKIQLPAGNTSFESTWIVSSAPINTPAEDIVDATFSLESTGTITETISANLGTGLDTLISQIFASSPTTFTALLSSGSTGNVEFTGPVWHSETEITIPVEGSEEGVTASGSLVAADALTIQDTP